MDSSSTDTSVPEFNPLPRKFVKLTTSNCKAVLTEYGENNPENRAEIITDFGTVVIELFEETPIHRANFVLLAKSGYFDQTVFSRVSKNFIIQGGNSDEEDVEWERQNIGAYSMPSEFKSGLYHLRGSVAMARGYDNNPDKLSAPFDFYMVQGTKVYDKTLDIHQDLMNFKYTENEREEYLQHGGAPHLDYEHTVFGKILKGIEVIDRMSKVEVDSKEWPKQDIGMKVRVWKE